MAAAAIATVTLAGCAIADSPPGWITNRMPLSSCGVEQVGEDQAYNEAARRCLLDAHRARRGAELITTQITEEGDPISGYIRVHENGVVELFIDATQDRFGSGTWERWQCEGLSAESDGRVFVPDECQQLPTP